MEKAEMFFIDTKNQFHPLVRTQDHEGEKKIKIMNNARALDELCEALCIHRDVKLKGKTKSGVNGKDILCALGHENTAFIAFKWGNQ